VPVTVTVTVTVKYTHRDVDHYYLRPGLRLEETRRRLKPEGC
jgi:hypothetical protein